MSKSLKTVLIAVAGIVGIVILISIALLFFIETSAYKSQVESAASEALGMQVRIGGRLGIGFFPGLHVTLEDVHIQNRGMDIASAKEASLELALIPLLHREVRITKIGLQRPRISIKRDHDGEFNFEPKKKAKGTPPVLSLATLVLSDGAFLYEDKRSGEAFEAGSFRLEVQGLRMAGRNRTELLKHLVFTAEFACRQIRTKSGLVLSDVKTTCRGKDGIFALDPVTLRLFGGQGSGSIGADFSVSVPRYSVRASLARFRIEAYIQTLFPKKIAEGSMDFSARLSMQGNTVKEIKQTAGGEVSLRGNDLTLYGYDLDREFSRFESSQSFSLVDAGAFFFAGPIGLAVTKGYDFASIFRGSGGSSSVEQLFSDWNVEHGIAKAKDVALATKENRVALRGSINFVNERFDDVTIALITARGCARVKQKIHGPLRKPVVEKPSVLMSLAGPALNLLKQAGDLFTDGTCEVFYRGSVPPPK
jgi:uncharacterized protein involved in outer membrane biogenesis